MTGCSHPNVMTHADLDTVPAEMRGVTTCDWCSAVIDEGNAVANANDVVIENTIITADNAVMDDDDQVAGFLEHLWGQGRHSVCWKRPQDTSLGYELVDTPKQAIDVRNRVDAPDVQSIWFGAAPLKDDIVGQRGEATDTAGKVALHVDLDPRGPVHPKAWNTETEIEASLAKVTTSAVVDTGHGVQAYWWLDRPIVDLEEWNAAVSGLRRLLVAAGLHEKTVERLDAASILRFPGSTNRKLADDPRPVTIRSMTDTVFAVEMFVNAPQLPSPPPVVHRRRIAGRLDEYVPYGLLGRLVVAEEGERNKVLNWAAHCVGLDVYHRKATRQQGDEVCEQLDRVAHLIGLDHDEIEPTITSGYSKGLAGRRAS